MEVAYETITKMVLGSITVRVWRVEPEMKIGPDAEVEDALLSVRKTGAAGRHGWRDIAKQMLSIERVSRVEIVNKHGEGILLNGAIHNGDS